MNKEVFLEVLRRSALLVGLLVLGSLGTLLTLKADAFWTVAGTVLAPVFGVLTVLARAWFRNRGQLTVQEVDAEFDKAESVIKP